MGGGERVKCIIFRTGTVDPRGEEFKNSIVLDSHRWARYFKKVAERALNAKQIFLSATGSALQGL